MPVTGPAPETDEISASIVAAARAEFEQFGIRRANVEQVARRAGVSRVTLYRRFASKADLVRAVVSADVAAFTVRFDAVWNIDAPIEDRLADVLVLTVGALRTHPLFNTMLRSEPEVLLPLLTVDGEVVFERTCDLLADRLQVEVEAGNLGDFDVRQTAELLVRLTHSFIMLPFGTVPGRTSKEVEQFARSVLAPALREWVS